MSDTYTLVPITDDGAYTELYRHADGSFGGHVEDVERAVEPRWTREQAERLHATLGHLLWPDQYDDPTAEDEDAEDEDDGPDAVALDLRRAARAAQTA